MKRLKIKLFLIQYRTVIAVVLLIMAGAVIASGLAGLDTGGLMEDPAVFGVMGTLLGAFIGGAFSLLGSVWVNTKQQQAMQNIERKKRIYSPLYDELMEIQCNVLKKNPYPSFVSFRKTQQTYIPHPQFTVWKQIKADTRYLEVPDILAKQMEQLETAIHSYLEVRGEVTERIQEIVNDILKPYDKLGCVISNSVTGMILGQEETDILREMEWPERDKQLGEAVCARINAEIYDRCEKETILREVREKYGAWLKLQEETIAMLSLLIRQVTVRYKG